MPKIRIRFHDNHRNEYVINRLIGENDLPPTHAIVPRRRNGSEAQYPSLCQTFHSPDGETTEAMFNHLEAIESWKGGWVGHLTEVAVEPFD